MGRHNAPEPRPTRLPAVRAAGRARGCTDQTLPGVLFPIVDDLSMISADDELLDLIAAGASLDSARPAAFGALPAVLSQWRAQLDSEPFPAVPTMAQVHRVMARPPVRPRRALRPILGVAVAITALLIGSTAVGAHSAKPGDTLWALNEVLYSDHAASVQAGVATQVSIDQAKNLISSGKAPQALQVLAAAYEDSKKVAVGDGRHQLQATLVGLWTKAGGSPAALQRTGDPVAAGGIALGADVPGSNTAKTRSGQLPAIVAVGSSSGTSAVGPLAVVAPLVPTALTLPPGSQLLLPSPILTPTGISVPAGPSSPSLPGVPGPGAAPVLVVTPVSPVVAPVVTAAAVAPTAVAPITAVPTTDLTPPATISTVTVTTTMATVVVIPPLTTAPVTTAAVTPPVVVAPVTTAPPSTDASTLSISDTPTALTSDSPTDGTTPSDTPSSGALTSGGDVPTSPTDSTGTAMSTTSVMPTPTPPPTDPATDQSGLDEANPTGQTPASQ